MKKLLILVALGLLTAFSAGANSSMTVVGTARISGNTPPQQQLPTGRRTPWRELRDLSFDEMRIACSDEMGQIGNQRAPLQMDLNCAVAFRRWELAETRNVTLDNSGRMRAQANTDKGDSTEQEDGFVIPPSTFTCSVMRQYRYAKTFNFPIDCESVRNMPEGSDFTTMCTQLVNGTNTVLPSPASVVAASSVPPPDGWARQDTGQVRTNCPGTIQQPPTQQNPGQQYPTPPTQQHPGQQQPQQQQRR
jgi:hypothetical protein